MKAKIAIWIIRQSARWAGLGVIAAKGLNLARGIELLGSPTNLLLWDVHAEFDAKDSTAVAKGELIT